MDVEVRCKYTFEDLSPVILLSLDCILLNFTFSKRRLMRRAQRRSDHRQTNVPLFLLRKNTAYCCLFLPTEPQQFRMWIHYVSSALFSFAASFVPQHLQISTPRITLPLTHGCSLTFRIRIPIHTHTAHRHDNLSSRRYAWRFVPLFPPTADITPSTNQFQIFVFIFTTAKHTLATAQ